MLESSPFSLRDIIIAVLIIAVTGIAMFLLKGLLSFGFILPIWLFVIILIVIIAIIFLLAVTIMRYMRWNPEGAIFMKARRFGIPVYIDAELGSNVGEFVLGEKDSPKDVILSNEDSGIKVDPSMLDSYAKPLRLPIGLDMYIDSYYNFMPQTVSNHAAFKTINNYFINECRELNFLTIKEFVELLSDPEHFLERNALVKLNKYFKTTEMRDLEGDIIFGEDGKTPKLTYVRQFMAKDEETGEIKRVEQDLTLPLMIGLITKARMDVSTMPIMGGLLAGTEAFKYNSVAYSSQHLAHVLMLYYQKMMNDLKNTIKWLEIGITALLICVGCAIAIYVISMAFKNGAGG